MLGELQASSGTLACGTPACTNTKQSVDGIQEDMLHRTLRKLRTPHMLFEPPRQLQEAWRHRNQRLEVPWPDVCSGTFAKLAPQKTG